MMLVYCVILGCQFVAEPQANIKTLSRTVLGGGALVSPMGGAGSTTDVTANRSLGFTRASFTGLPKGANPVETEDEALSYQSNVQSRTKQRSGLGWQQTDKKQSLNQGISRVARISGEDTRIRVPNTRYRNVLNEGTIYRIQRKHQVSRTLETVLVRHCAEAKA